MKNKNITKPKGGAAVGSSAGLGVGLWLALVVCGVIAPGGLAVLLALNAKGIEWLILLGLIVSVYDCGRTALNHPWKRETPNDPSSGTAADNPKRKYAK